MQIFPLRTNLRPRSRPHFWPSTHQAEIEHSLLLRVLVQALVTVGILATDMAAGTSNSAWAVPLSLLGASWSWQRRRRRNWATKGLIAFGMLVILGLFFSRLVGQLNDSRIVLAELLIQLQVLHTFDLPRRKDLGYSTVIAIILIGVAATVSETTPFGGLLFIFLAIALPALILDYRSRLGLPVQTRHPISVAPKRLGLILLVVVGLGLLIFAVTPRLPGYQLRNFPVSSPIDFQGQFNGQQIVNPGYVRENPTGTEGGPGNGDFNGEPTFNTQFYYGFNQEINQNRRGTLIPRVVMRVRSQAKGFWRVLAFDHYTGQGWTITRNQDTQTLKRGSLSYRFSIPHTWPFGPSKEVIQTYSIVAPFPNLIPALNHPQQLYFPTREVAVDPDGSLRSPVPLQEGLTYTVISQVPYRDRTQLSTAPTAYPPMIRERYLQLPDAITTKVRRQTETLLAQSSRPLTAPYEQALYLAQALKQNYTLQPELPPLNPSEDLVDAFLFKSEGGYPDHFSTTLTIMLRSIGLPARLVTGLGPGQFNPFTGMYEVKNTDAYALTEVYFPEFGWFAFDPIPGHELLPPSVEVDQTFSVLRQFWHWLAGWLPSPLTGWLSGTAALLATVFGLFLGLFTRGWSGIILGLMIGTGLVCLLWLMRFSWQRWQQHRWLASLPPMERLYQQMLTWLATRGTHKQSNQTALEYLHQVSKYYPTHQAESVQQITQAYLAWRYGNHSPPLSHLHRQLQLLQRQRQRPRRVMIQNLLKPLFRPFT